MARRTPEQTLAHEMQKLKDMGVTIRVIPSAVPTEFTPLAHTLAEAATAAGINEETSTTA